MSHRAPAGDLFCRWTPCPVCKQEPMDDSVACPSGHRLCQPCANSVIDCPMCKKPPPGGESSPPEDQPARARRAQADGRTRRRRRPNQEGEDPDAQERKEADGPRRAAVRRAAEQPGGNHEQAGAAARVAQHRRHRQQRHRQQRHRQQRHRQPNALAGPHAPGPGYPPANNVQLNYIGQPVPSQGYPPANNGQPNYPGQLATDLGYLAANCGDYHHSYYAACPCIAPGYAPGYAPANQEAMYYNYRNPTENLRNCAPNFSHALFVPAIQTPVRGLLQAASGRVPVLAMPPFLAPVPALVPAEECSRCGDHAAGRRRPGDGNHGLFSDSSSSSDSDSHHEYE